jgi:ferric-dicitrate binding protein FerR (iron transport regulator)
MDTECQRWIDLSDRKSVGDAISDLDLAWLTKHVQSCDECGREAAFYEGLHESLGSPESLLFPVPAVAPKVQPRPRRAWAIGLAAAAGIAITFAALHGLWRPAHFASTPKSQLSPRATLTFASGGTTFGTKAIQAGASLVGDDVLTTDDGAACAAIAGSITLCLDAHSATSIKFPSSQQIVVRLEKGRLLARLDKQPEGREFLVRAPHTEVRAVGTRFVVDAREPGCTVVRLRQGKVALRTSNQLSGDLTAPAQASVTDSIRVENLEPADAGEDRLLEGLAGLPRDEKGARVRIASTPAGAEVTLGGVSLGQTPVSTIVSKGMWVRLSLAGYEPVDDWLDVTDGASYERVFALSPPALGNALPHARRHHASVPTAAAGPDPGQLLARAQAMRAQGNYKECARIYRTLIADFPRSQEAKVSLVALGELELAELNQPAAAFEAFSAYVRAGGPLLREARYGKIRALRALHRDTEAEGEIATFLIDYPTSIQAATIRQRSQGK